MSKLTKLTCLIGCALFPLFCVAATGAVSESFDSARPGLLVPLGIEDQIALQAPDIPSLDKREFVVDADGTVSIPIVGPVRAAGFTTSELAAAIISQLKKLYRDPQISVSIVKLKSRTVAVLGAVNNPGIQPLEGRRTILDILAAAGGLRQDAGPIVEITRASSGKQSSGDYAMPPQASDRDFEVQRIAISSLLEGEKPQANVSVVPGDVVTVPKGKLVYVVGDVKKPGGFVIGESDNLTVLKAISLSEGLESTASAAHARLLRSDGPGKRSEEDIDLRKLLSGKTEDIPLKADDILFVPSSTGKKFAVRAMEAAIQTGSGVAIFRP